MILIELTWYQIFYFAKNWIDFYQPTLFLIKSELWKLLMIMNMITKGIWLFGFWKEFRNQINTQNVIS